MATKFKGPDGPNRASPSLYQSRPDETSWPIGQEKLGPSENVEAEEIPRTKSRWARAWRRRRARSSGCRVDGTSRRSRGGAASSVFIALFGFVLLAAGAHRVPSGASFYAALDVATIYYAIGTLLFLGGAYVLVFVPSYNKTFAVTAITVVGTAIAATPFVPHHETKELVLDANHRVVVRGGFRQVSGTAPERLSRWQQ